MPPPPELVSHLLIAACKAFIGGCLYWMWSHRRGDWPKSWIILAFGLFCVSSAARETAAVVWPDTGIFEWALGVHALMCLAVAVVLPPVVRTLLALPTPRQYEQTVQNALAKKQTEERAEFTKAERDKAERQRDRLKAILLASALPGELKEQVIRALEE
jgi:uncharacterized membrane protein YfcA